MAVLVLFSQGEVINIGNRLENLGIGLEVAAVAGGQDVPFFEVGEGVFDNENPANKW